MAKAMFLALASVLVALTVASDRPVDWEALNCPSGRFDNSCQYANKYPDDMAITVFFQHEDYDNNADFSCRGGGVTYCQRSWDVSEAGSAGDCFFLLPAGESYSCDGHNNVKVIGAHGVRLNGTVLEQKEWQPLSCPSKNGDCSYDNQGGDKWVQANYDFKEGGSIDMRCSVDNTAVCSYINVNSSFSDRSSCSFILPHGKSLKCSVKGSLDNVDVATKTFTKTMFPSTPITNITACPTKTYPKSTMCDCTFENPYDDRDVVISMTPESVDANFNSFHCAVWGANVCAWGTARGNKGDAGTCYFVLPAGAKYDCQMQWGATAFVSTSAQPLATSIFKPNFSAEKPKQVAAQPQKAARSVESLRTMFAEWKERHGKRYESASEEATRFENFAHFVGLADAMNEIKIEVSTINHLADMSVDEFESTYKGCARVDKDMKPNWEYTLEELNDLPTSVDWRKKGAVTPVKDQGQCGSCWSFSTTGALEGAWYLAGHELTGLSEQTLVSCEKDCDGCGGGWPYRAMDWVMKNGIDTEASYPYTSGKGESGNCYQQSHQSAEIKVTGHVMIPQDENAMMVYLAKYGPVSISLDAMTQLWWPYAGGIMKTCCNKEPDHAVLLVGYGEENGTKYWLVKNSWGESWGENGYIRLERGTDQCGLTVAAVSPTVDGGSLPPPPPPPGPEGRCPEDARVVNTTDGYHHCLWINGTKNVTMPPTAQDYCMYIVKDKSFGYVWDKGTAAGFDVYPCPPSATGSETKDSYFCTITDGEKGAYLPVDVEPDCANVTRGVFGWKWQ